VSLGISPRTVAEVASGVGFPLCRTSKLILAAVSGAKFYCLGTGTGAAGEETAGRTVVEHLFVNRYDEMAAETGLVEGDAAIHATVSLVGRDGTPAASSFLRRERDRCRW
jgi:hypothetical protein